MANTHHTGIPKLQWSFEYPPCTPSVTIVADKNPFCLGDGVTFIPTFACVDDVTITAYGWVVNGSIQSTSAEPFVTNTLTNGNSVYMLFITSTGQTYFSNVITMQEKTEGCITEIKYGLLYNWYAANDIRNISSDDEWTVPFYEDWANLQTLVSSDSRLLKESGTTYWDEGNEGTNQLNFNARGGGIREEIFEGLKYNSVYWCKGIYDNGYNEYTAMFLLNISNYCYFYLPNYSIEPYIGASIRLFRDASESELSLDDGTACAPYIGNDGKVYPTVKIGEKVYLAQNLCETKFRDGSWIEGFNAGVYTPISNEVWDALETDAMCAYNNDLNNV